MIRHNFIIQIPEKSVIWSSLYILFLYENHVLGLVQCTSLFHAFTVLLFYNIDVVVKIILFFWDLLFSSWWPILKCLINKTDDKKIQTQKAQFLSIFQTRVSFLFYNGLLFFQGGHLRLSYKACLLLVFKIWLQIWFLGLQPEGSLLWFCYWRQLLLKTMLWLGWAGLAPQVFNRRTGFFSVFCHHHFLKTERQLLKTLLMLGLERFFSNSLQVTSLRFNSFSRVEEQSKTVVTGIWNLISKFVLGIQTRLAGFFNDVLLLTFEDKETAIEWRLCCWWDL